MQKFEKKKGLLIRLVGEYGIPTPDAKCAQSVHKSPIFRYTT